ncbi:type VII secretion target [Mycobacterium sp. 141]|uniref:type VII secretion target n=1 Tax=Mycobacterium sp. 141 TaxID=1120797 RepID=UPI00039CC197|nr:type VII secretion target [Mycobacterium sp. 141]
MTETLRIDTDLVRDAGNRLSAIAGQIPSPPAVTPVTGADELSTTISSQITKVVDPVLTQLPEVKDAFAAYSGNVTSAASTYQTTDEQISQDIKRKLGILGDESSSSYPSGGSAGAPASAYSAADPTMPAQDASPAGGDQGMGQIGQMMQTAQQAAQVPGQMVGSVSQLPQQVTQGAQQIVEAAKSQGDGQDADRADDVQGSRQDKQGLDAESKDNDSGHATSPPAGAHGGTGEAKAPVQHPQAVPAPGNGTGERAPVNPSPAVPPRHAADPTRDV